MMRELFDRLIAEGEAGIDRLVAEATQETVMLDFKEARGAPTGILTAEDRKTFAKALSAFANSAGGLLVFGVEARKGADKVDCAQVPKPISNISLFKSEATTASGQLLHPRHDGILVEAIPSKKHQGSGYLLVYVERSERRPHRSEASGQKQYFKRAGDSSFEMEHYDIEDAFRRVHSPELSVYFRYKSNAGSAANALLVFDLFLRNDGRITADDVYCHIHGMTNCELASSPYLRPVEGGTNIVASTSPLSINPGLSTQLASFVIRSTAPSSQTAGQVDGRTFSFRCTYGARDSVPKTAEYSEVIALVPKTNVFMRPVMT